MMDGDIGAVQDVIKLLAKDAGLAFIRTLADVHIPRADNSCKATLWETEVKPLFTLVTHPRVVDSTVLEQQVADVFNCILGVGGQRMTRTFNFIIGLVTGPLPPTQNDSQMEVLELSLSVLSKVIDCNTRNIVNSECERLVLLFTQIVESDHGKKDEFSRLQASRYIDYMQQRLDTGKNIPDLEPSRRVLLAREDFVIRHDLPGTLSADGPRHNNDHVDITKIKIMPTYEDISRSAPRCCARRTRTCPRPQTHQRSAVQHSQNVHLRKPSYYRCQPPSRRGARDVHLLPPASSR